MAKNNVFTLINAADLLSGPPAPPVDFVLPGLPSGQAGQLVGADGSGKSNLALQYALAVACGIPVAGGLLPAPRATGRVLYLWGEDDIDEAHRRLDAWLSVAAARGVDPRTVRDGLANLEFHVLDGARMPLMKAGRQDSEPRPTEHASTLLTTMQGARLTIIDPMIMFHSLSEADNGHLVTFMRLLIRMARQSGGGSVLVVHHTGQEAILNRRDDHQSGRGGTALAAASRAVWVLRGMSEIEEDAVGIEPGRGRVCSGPKISRGPRQPGRVLRITDGGVPWLDETATAILVENRKRKGKKTPGQEKQGKVSAPHERRAKRGLGNLVGEGAEEFDKKQRDRDAEDEIGDDW